MRHLSFALAACALIASGARDASAQWLDLGYVNVNYGLESTSGTLTDDATFTLYSENGSKRVNAVVDSGPFFDFSAGTRVWGNVSVGVGFHREKSTGQADLAATIPHPLFFNQNRATSLRVEDLERTERGIHVQIGYMLVVTDDLDIHLFGGPSFFRLNQAVVGDLTFAEGGFPFSSVSATPVVTERKRSINGANVGVDITYRIPRTRVGAGAFVRYAGASAKVQLLDSEGDSDVGGLQIGGGVRFRF